MKLRLFHQLFLLVAVTALVAALSMVAVLSFNLDRGFTHYLDERDAQELEAFVTSAEARFRALSEVNSQPDQDTDLTTLLSEMIRSGDLRRPPPGFGRRGMERQPPIGDVGPGPPPRRPRGERGPPPDTFGARLMVFDASGVQVFGPPPPPPRIGRGLTMLERSLEIDGKIMGRARLLPRQPTPDGVDARFLRSQYLGAAALTALLLAMASVPAYLLARRGAARLADMQRTTDAISLGDFKARVDLRGNDELSAMAQNINEMAASLEHLEGARRRWLAEIGHELRTPLTALLAELEALQDGVRVIDMAAIRSLAEEATRLNLLVEDLHFLAMSDLAAPPCHFTPADAVEIVEGVGARFGRDLRAAGLELTTHFDHPGALPIIWDRARIDQLFANLLTNSRRYTDAPGQVRISLLREGNTVKITVEDSAPGVAAQHLQDLFEPLYRIEEARDRASGGSGLGLAVSKAIVVAHGGSIAAAPSRLGGLLIDICLPLDARPA